jgi:uncharacterized membrane protein SirB2
VLEFYPAIKLLHVGAVLASGGLFFVRGLAVNLGAGWAMARPLRMASYLIDTVLLAAAILLAILLHQYPFAQAWLTAKVLLLVVYVVLGSFALKRGRTRTIRFTCWLAAVAVFGLIITIAVLHDPLGPFRSQSG